MPTRTTFTEFLLSWFYTLLQTLAEKNILHTRVEEGQIKTIILRGGQFFRAVMFFKGYHLNDPALRSRGLYQADQPAWEVLPNAPGKTDDDYDLRSRLEKKLGLYWVGWPWRNEVYRYTFEWNETKIDKQNGEKKIWPRKKLTDFLYAKDFPYVMVTSGAETEEGVPTNEQTGVTVAVTNPYKALFAVEDWMRRVTDAINSHTRDFVAQLAYKVLLKLDDGKKSEYSRGILGLNDRLVEDDPDLKKTPWYERGFKGKYGITVKAGNLLSVELTGDQKAEYQKAAAAAFVADANATATKTAADATAYATEKTGTAKANITALNNMVEIGNLQHRLAVIDASPHGMALATADTLKETAQGEGNRTFIWANDPFKGAAGVVKEAIAGEASS